MKDGAGVIIGLIDTAVQRQGAAFEKFLLPGISIAGDPSISTDQPTHGTSMFETLLRGISVFNEGNNSSGVRILPVDVYGPNGTTTTYEVAEGIYQAMQKGATSINLSLKSDGDTPFLSNIIRAGSETGHKFIASAGNTPVNVVLIERSSV